MPRLPRITARDARRAIERDGWYHVGGSGSHQEFKHPSKPGRVTIVFHGAATLKADTFKRIIQQAGPTVDQFVALL